MKGTTVRNVGGSCGRSRGKTKASVAMNDLRPSPNSGIHSPSSHSGQHPRSLRAVSDVRHAIRMSKVHVSTESYTGANRHCR